MATTKVLSSESSKIIIPNLALSVVVILFLSSALLGLAIAPNIDLSLNRLAVLLVGLALFIAVLLLVRTEAHALRLAVLLMLLGVAVALLSIVVTSWTPGRLLPIPSPADRFPLLLRLPGSGVPSPTAGVNPRLVGGTLAFLLPLPLTLALFGRGRRLRLLAALASLPIFFVLFLTQAPQAFLGIALAFALILTWQARWTILIQIPIVLSAFVAWLLWRWWLPSALVERLDIGVSARLQIWPSALAMIRDMPFTGIGLNNFPVVDPLYSVRVSRTAHAHNVFLQTATDLGILGLIAMIFLFIFALRAGWRAYHASNNHNFRAVMLGCAAAVIAFLGFGLWDSISLGHKPAPAMWAFLGLLIAGERCAVSQQVTKIAARRIRGLILALSVAVLLTSPFWSSSLALNLGRILFHRTTIPSETDQNEITKVSFMTQLAIRLNPANSRAHFLAGLVDLERDQPEKAVEHLNDALEHDPRDLMIHFHLAETYNLLGHREQAFSHWRAAGAAQLLFQRGVLAQQEEDYIAAAEWFQVAIFIDPNDPSSWLRLANSQTAMGRFQEAAETYDGIISRFPEDSRGYEGLAKRLINDLDKTNRARGVLEAGLSRAQPPGAQLYYLRSMLNAETGDLPAAIADANKAIARQPNGGAYMIWLGDLYFQQDRYQEAVDQYQITIVQSEQPNWVWRAYARLGNVYTSRQQWPDALVQYQTALKLSIEQNAPSAVISANYASLGQIYETIGDRPAAIVAYRLALQHNPKDAQLNERLVSLQQ